MSVLSIDTGGTNTKMAVITSAGECLGFRSVLTPKDSITSWYDLIAKAYEHYRKIHAIEAVALSCPGAVSSELGIIYGSSALPYLHGPNIVEYLSARLSIPISIVNDANAMALGEHWKGSASEKKNVVMVVLGTGIGGAIIQKGMLQLGSHLHGGEFGYMWMGTGIWSECASAGALIRNVNALDLNIDYPTAESILRETTFRAKKSDGRLEACTQAWADALAVGLFNIQYAIDPDCIVLGGAITGEAALLPIIEGAVSRLMDKVAIATVVPKVFLSALGGNAQLYGAAYWHWHYQ